MYLKLSRQVLSIVMTTLYIPLNAHLWGRRLTKEGVQNEMFDKISPFWILY